MEAARQRQEALIREFEERMRSEYQQGKLPGVIHIYRNQEAVAVAACLDLTNEDYIASTHRGHGHCIAKGCEIESMLLELACKEDGLCNGKGGSMHIADMSKGMLGANAIVGGGPPIAAGAARAGGTHNRPGLCDRAARRPPPSCARPHDCPPNSICTNTESSYTFPIGHNSTDIASVFMQVVGPFTRVHMRHGGFSLIVPGPLYHNTVVAESAN